MSRKAVLALSAALSAFILILAGAAASLAWRPVAPPAAAIASVPADVVRAREAEYRRLIDEANARLRALQAPAAGAGPAAAEPTRLSARDPEAEGDEEHERHGHHARRSHHEREDDDG
jgi:hypothetical protein